jgi:hypothetical protein
MRDTLANTSHKLVHKRRKGESRAASDGNIHIRAPKGKQANNDMGLSQAVIAEIVKDQAAQIAQMTPAEIKADLDLMTPAQVKASAKVAISTVYKWFNEGRLPVWDQGDNKRVRPHAYYLFIRAKEAIRQRAIAEKRAA